MASPFEILGVDADADDDEVVDAYRERVKEAHPDHGGSTHEFQLVRTAYEEIKAGTASENGETALEPETAARPRARARASASGSGASADAGTDASGGTGGEDAEPEPEGIRVEYLNYDALADHGWELDDPDLFENASRADLDPTDYGRFLAGPGDPLLESAEDCGFGWPYACRGGACANCAVAVLEGEMEMPPNHVLSQEMVDRGIRLSCVSAPVTDEMKVVYNVKHLPGLDELRLPAKRFGRESPTG